MYCLMKDILVPRILQNSRYIASGILLKVPSKEYLPTCVPLNLEHPDVSLNSFRPMQLREHTDCLKRGNWCPLST